MSDDIEYVIDWFSYKKSTDYLKVYCYQTDNYPVSEQSDTPLQESLEHARGCANAKLLKKIAKLQAKLDYNNVVTVDALIEEANVRAQQEQEEYLKMAKIRVGAAKADIVFWESKLK